MLITVLREKRVSSEIIIQKIYRKRVGNQNLPTKLEVMHFWCQYYTSTKLIRDLAS